MDREIFKYSSNLMGPYHIIYYQNFKSIHLFGINSALYINTIDTRIGTDYNFTMYPAFSTSAKLKKTIILGKF